jgi:hypothetical protein
VSPLDLLATLLVYGILAGATLWSWRLLGLIVAKLLDLTLDHIDMKGPERLETHASVIWTWPIFLVMLLILLSLVTINWIIDELRRKDDDQWAEDEIVEEPNDV